MAALILSSSMLHWNAFQEFQPIGGTKPNPLLRDCTEEERRRKIVVGTNKSKDDFIFWIFAKRVVSVIVGSIGVNKILPTHLTVAVSRILR